METRNLVFSEGTSDKFWNITLNGNEHTVQYGRIGTAGQTQTKTFATEAEAKTSYTKLVAEKVKKGYQDAGGTVTPSPPTSPPTPLLKERGASSLKNENLTKVTQLTSEGGVVQDTNPGQSEHASEVETESPLSTQTRRGAGGEVGHGGEVETGALPPPPVPRFNLDAGALSGLRPGKPNTKPRPAARPFDKEECLKRLGSIKERGYFDWWWSSARIQLEMSREEAEFWLAAMVPTLPIKGMETKKHYGRYDKPQEAATALRNVEFTGTINVEEVISGIKQHNYSSNTPGDIVLSLYALFGWEQIFVIAASKHYIPEKIVDGVRTRLLPVLHEEEIEEGRNALRSRLTDIKQSTPIYLLQCAACMGGFEEEIRAYLKHYGNGVGYGSTYAYENELLQVAVGLTDPDEVAGELHRIDLLPRTAAEVEAVLAATQTRCLDLIRRGIGHQNAKPAIESMVKALAKAETPEVAPVMLDLFLDEKAPRIAREWFDANPDHTIIGLVPSIVSATGKHQETILELLRTYRQRGHTARIVEQAEKMDEKCLAYLREQVLDVEVVDYPAMQDKDAPLWLKDALAASKGKPAKTDSLRANELPPVPLVVGEATLRLNGETGGKLLAALRVSTWESVDPLVSAVREHVDRRALNTFVWKLFENWLKDGAPSKAKWEMMAVGFLGNDAAALKLAPMIRVWPGEAQHQRAVLGLECLRAIGSDVALMQINGIAQKVAFKGLKERAGECMEDIAKARGMSREELEDRIVPDCELDARGSRVFDFGPRQFTFVLGQDMKPMIRDAEKNRRPDLPKPNSKDDAEKANLAVEEWKLLKKQISDVTKIQIVRLEQAMVTGRRWKPQDFDLLLVRHPLMINLVRLLIWGAYDGEGNLLATFRVTEDQTFADENDDLFELPAETASIGLVHTLHLTDEVRNAWGEILSDYEIIAPFPQIGRSVYGLEGKEVEDSKITRFDSITIPPQALIFTLDKLGWTRGTPMDAGFFTEHIKAFHAANITAVVVYTGVPIGYMDGWEDQKIEHLYFLKGTSVRTGYMSWAAKDAIPLIEIDPVVISEVLKDLTSIVAKSTVQTE